LLSDVAVKRCRRFRSRSAMIALFLSGKRINRPLSILNDRVAGLYSPPGEIRVGLSLSSGAMQTVPTRPESTRRHPEANQQRTYDGIRRDFRIEIPTTRNLTSLGNDMVGLAETGCSARCDWRLTRNAHVAEVIPGLVVPKSGSGKFLDHPGRAVAYAENCCLTIGNGKSELSPAIDGGSVPKVIPASSARSKHDVDRK
jgi:hypothetical protein